MESAPHTMPNVLYKRGLPFRKIIKAPQYTEEQDHRANVSAKKLLRVLVELVTR